MALEWCERAGKHIYKSKAKAGELLSHKGRRKRRIDSYSCPFCGGWHLGHSLAIHRSRRKSRKEQGDFMMASAELVATSGVQEVHAILTKLTQDVAVETQRHHRKLAELNTEASTAAAKVIAREPVLDMEQD